MGTAVTAQTVSNMRTVIDPSHEKGAFSEYQILGNKTWFSLTNSTPLSLKSAVESLLQPGALRCPRVQMSRRISTSAGGSVINGHQTLAGIAAGGAALEVLRPASRHRCSLWISELSVSQIISLESKAFPPVARMRWNNLRDFPMAVACLNSELRWDQQISRSSRIFSVTLPTFTSRDLFCSL